MNIWDVLILLLVFGALAYSIRILHVKGRSGKCTCGCDGCTKKCQKENNRK